MLPINQGLHDVPEYGKRLCSIQGQENLANKVALYKAAAVTNSLLGGLNHMHPRRLNQRVSC